MNIHTASTWVEIDLDTIRSNTRIMCRNAGVPIMAIVKGNAYGHGFVEVSRAAMDGGASCLGVARLEEAQVIRDGGIDAPILVLGFVHPERANEVVECAATLTVYDAQLARQLSDEALKIGAVIPVHAKIDTGMRRLGVFSENGVDFLRLLHSLPGLKVTGMFTHFPRIDEVKHPTTYTQLERFKTLIQKLRKAGIETGIIHASTSAGLLYMPEARFDMVRSGITIYGLMSTEDVPQFDGIRPALSWKARIVSIKTVPAGEGVGYNHRYFTQKDERIGVIAVGYGDGMRRKLGNFALIGGKRVNMVGGMCMDQCMVNLDSVPDAIVGDEAVLIGTQGSEKITAEDIAHAWNTTNYEVVNSLHARVPRFYLNV
jgi:alanine racemase